MRMVDFVDPAILQQRLETELPRWNRVLEGVYDAAPIQRGPLVEKLAGDAERLRPFVAPTEELIAGALADGAQLVIECAQGAMLDVDYGTYPFVTSSATTAAGACQGAGVPPSAVQRVLGVFKAYSTRVGAGPLPTELVNETGALIRERGREYGTTTGRPRRTGWFDAVAARYVARLNGVTDIALTLLDVFDAFETIDVCVAYELDGRIVDTVPAHLDRISGVTPVYETLRGWNERTDAVRALDDLPGRAREFVEFLERQIGVPISLVGVGPAREQIIPMPRTQGLVAGRPI
jgi:adenylosuccinate synthase